MKILIVGNRDGTNVGGCFERAGAGQGLDVRLVESRLAMEAPGWLRRFNWWFRGKRPTRLKPFSEHVLEVCGHWGPDYLLATGIAPLTKYVLREIGSRGIRRVNYQTDDPWNPAHRASWFLEALPYYDLVYSTRRSNLDQLIQFGCPDVRYLPFAYAPELHFEESRTSPEEEKQFASDVVFVGSGDRDRAPYISRMVREGFEVGLYGSFWERFRETRGLSRGQADARTMRLAIGGAKVALCLLRRANRDGNSMRTFEIPAIGACMLTEETGEHREIFGRDGEAVLYFKSIEEMIQKLRWLLDHEGERRRLARSAHERIMSGKHTYRDRLMTMLGLGGEEA